MSTTRRAAIEQGNEALAGGDWAAARKAYQDALQDSDAPEAHYGLAEALWWLGDMDGAMAHFEAAYVAARKSGNTPFAAGAAVRIGFHSKAHLANAAAASGWLARAERLIEVEGLDSLRGGLLLMKSYCADDARQGEVWAREALDGAREAGDLDLELCALSQLGVTLVKQGRIAEGTALLDESMAGSLGGEPGELETVVFTSCNMMVSCARCAELKRAMEWVRAAERFVERYGCPFLYVECRTIYGSVLVARGDWDEAEGELKVAIDLARGSVPAYFADALSALAELRVAQGRLEEGERLLDGVKGTSRAVPVLARIHLLRGHPEKAAAEVRRRLDVLHEDQLESVGLIEILGEAEIAQGDCGSAAERGRAVAERGAERGCEIAVARGERLRGKALAPSDRSAARRHLGAAMETFIRLGMPYEAACTRLAMAESHDDPEIAIAEARAALDVFEELGAAREGDRAAALLRSFGVKAARTGSRGLEPLSQREREVLALVGEGLSNPEIGERLFISRKTVEHHVSSILSKLGLKNRAEAAAEAVRRLGSGGSGQ